MPSREPFSLPWVLLLLPLPSCRNCAGPRASAAPSPQGATLEFLTLQVHAIEAPAGPFPWLPRRLAPLSSGTILPNTVLIQRKDVGDLQVRRKHPHGAVFQNGLEELVDVVFLPHDDKHRDLELRIHNRVPLME